MSDDTDEIDEATHGSGIRNAGHGAGSDKARLTRPGKQPVKSTDDLRPASGQTARKDRSAQDVGQE
jgi:hypothetical protein